MKRVWDNPYDPRSDRSLWTPDSLKVKQISPEDVPSNSEIFKKNAGIFRGFQIFTLKKTENLSKSLKVSEIF